MNDDLSRAGIMVKIATTGSGDKTIYTPPTGKRWVLYYMNIESDGATDVVIKSGATAMSGIFALTTTIRPPFQNSGSPVAIANAASDTFVLNSSAVQSMDGWAILGLLDR